MREALHKVQYMLLRLVAPRKTFDYVYKSRFWGRDQESVSGPGSSMEATAVVRRVLPEWIREFGIRSILDVPCGDFHWMKTVDLGVERYIGGDIVAALIEDNRSKYTSGARRFEVIDLSRDALPKADAVFCRDCLVHLSYKDQQAALRAIASSGAKYLITTTFSGKVERNKDIITGSWRPIDLRLPPYSFPEPLRIVSEETEPRHGKYIAIWRVADLPGELRLS